VNAGRRSRTLDACFRSLCLPVSPPVQRAPLVAVSVDSVLMAFERFRAHVEELRALEEAWVEARLSLRRIAVDLGEPEIAIRVDWRCPEIEHLTAVVVRDTMRGLSVLIRRGA